MGITAARFRSASFIITALCCLLPFLTVSCPGGSRTLTGLQLAAGTTIEEPQAFGPPKSQRIDGEPLALAALACAAVGAVVALSRGARGRTASIVLALVGGVLLLAVQSRIGQQVQAQGMGILSVKYEVGYWVALLGYAAAFVSAFIVRVPAAAAEFSALARHDATIT